MKCLRLASFLLIAALMFSFASPTCIKPAFSAAQPVEEETIAGTVMKTEKGIVIEADDGDYLVKGQKAQELSKMVGKLVEVTGVITESEKGGDSIEVKSFEEIQE